MPSTLQQALEVQLAAAELGFDWPNTCDVFSKLDEEIAETKVAIADQDYDAMEDELGDVFYTLINLARHLNVDPGTAISRATDKFSRRFTRLKKLAGAENLDLEISNIQQLETLWQRIK